MTQIIIGTTPTITYTFHVVSPADLTKERCGKTWCVGAAVMVNQANIYDLTD